MNTHDIKLPPLPEDLIAPMMLASEVRSLLRRYGERCASAAIEADRKLHDRMLAHEWIRPALGLSEDAPYRFDFYAQEIEKLKANRQRRGEPVAMIRHFHYQGIARSGLAQEAVMLDGAPTLPDGAMLYAAPQPAEPVNLCDCERSHNGLGMGGRECDCPAGQSQQPTEPVKVPSDEEVLDIAIDSGLAFRDSAGEVLCAWREDADISEYLVENARALLARYSHLTATTHKSSNQNRLIEDLKLVYGDNKPIATVITHNNHKLLSFDPGALDELPEGTILYAKK